MFNMVCPGNAISVFHEMLLLLKNATVNKNLGFDDICNEKHVYVAYNNNPWFEVSNITGEMVELLVEPYVSYANVAHEWEIQAAFFKYNKITPQWLNCNGSWWSRAVGLIQRDEADYAKGDFACNYERSKVAACSQGTVFSPYYWLTRYPLELSPTWNLLGVFTKAIKSQKQHFETKLMVTLLKRS